MREKSLEWGRRGGGREKDAVFELKMCLICLRNEGKTESPRSICVGFHLFKDASVSPLEYSDRPCQRILELISILEIDLL